VGFESLQLKRKWKFARIKQQCVITRYRVKPRPLTYLRRGLKPTMSPQQAPARDKQFPPSRNDSMEEWGSSVWATPSTPATLPEKKGSPTEKSPDAATVADPAPFQTQTLSFVDDAFDDKSVPSTPAVFPPKPAVPKFDTDDAFDTNDGDFGPPADDGFGDFDDFGAPASSQTLDDDFGDFGDFGDGDAGGGFGAGPSNGFVDAANGEFGQGGFGMGDVKASSRWQPLDVDPLPPPQEFAEQVKELLKPIWAHLQPDEFLSDEPERQVEGIAQILVTPER
jgi:hypothetical protein